MKKSFAALMLATFFTLTTSNYNISHAATSVKEFQSQTAISQDKVWTVKFNFNLNEETINNSNITVTDDKGNAVQATVMLGDTANTIKVLPKVEGYTPAKSYYVNVSTQVESLGGKKLNQPVKMKFTITPRFSDGSTYVNGAEVKTLKMQYEPIISNQYQTFNLSSSVDNAQYKIYVSRYNKKLWKYEDFQEWTNGYTTASSGKITINKRFTSDENGDKYKILVYVKRSNTKGNYKDINTDYDNYYIDYLRCINSISNTDIVNKSYVTTFTDAISKQAKPGVSTTSEGGSGWVGASYNQIKYHLNPKNFMDQDGKYAFMKLSYTNDSITVQDLNNILMGRGILAGKGQAFFDAAKANNINPIYLVSHALLETGNGSSKLANGIEVDGDKGKKLVYNMFGIGALDSNPDELGSKYAYEQGWFTPEDAIKGGAKFIGSGYINNTTNNQDTLYKMKFNPGAPATHQYATDINWPYAQIRNIINLVSQCKDPKITFEVPVYK
ncbi:beta-N-acetylglucosaminidase [Clostridium pascui]|uniref:N-acetylglucosaminidase n=1 Tax=Clostridium pascui TaxID=46609 RepID=UPI00195B053B|nr:N-acetylglucosaminidase [Clostridium pascui]MBM7870642.1 beta-N-acetylglucosaminidase [Clostridium pascui]